ncbi:MAG TPA: MBL fold metallo-hydrolase [Polyangiaceae bacterium]|nr:MBL fold metallo-hydrolase [Polyangiaceae bacterium]
MQVEPFFDPETSTLTYLVYDPETRDAIVIDPVLDYDQGGAQTSTASVEKLAAVVTEQRLQLHYLLETHAHADHLSGSQYLRRRFGAKVAIGERIRDVQETFKGLFDLPPQFAADGRQFDQLLADGEVLAAGSLRVRVIATPGHTPACVTYEIEDALFTGDAVFIEDSGTGRCDFPKGSADDLYTSVHDKLYAFPDETRIFVGHDYQPNGRPLRYVTTVGASKRENTMLKESTSRADFVRARTSRDATLKAPRLLLPSVQVNIDAGRLPETHANGQRYLSIPLNVFRPADEVGAPVPR